MSAASRTATRARMGAVEQKDERGIGKEQQRKELERLERERAGRAKTGGDRDAANPANALQGDGQPVARIQARRAKP